MEIYRWATPITDRESKITKAVVGIRQDDYEKHAELLEKMMGALKISTDEFFVLEITDDSTNYHAHKILEQLNCTHLFSFGVSARRFGFPILPKLNTKIELNGIQFLFSNSLEDISNNKNLKASLWGAMQTLNWE